MVPDIVGGVGQEVRTSSKKGGSHSLRKVMRRQMCKQEKCKQASLAHIAMETTNTSDVTYSLAKQNTTCSVRITLNLYLASNL